VDEDIAEFLDILEPHQLPEPYQRLLVHRNDMTGTLERYHGQPMALRVLKKRVTADEVARQVELVGQDDGRTAEFGAIRVNLDCFEGEARNQILECRRPLGGILTEFSIEFTSRPSVYFCVRPDAGFRHSLRIPGAGRLYGRCNQLLTADGAVIADVVEILPPDLPS